jgi:hypothetical protein
MWFLLSRDFTQGILDSQSVLRMGRQLIGAQDILKYFIIFTFFGNIIWSSNNNT